MGLVAKLHEGASITNLGLENANIQGHGDFIGGLVGKMYEASVSSSYSTGVITGGNGIGALVGSSDRGSISNSYSEGLVAGQNEVGGLLGKGKWSSVSNSYSTCMVTGESRVGGLVGYSDRGCVSNSFWDIEMSGLHESDGGMGSTTAQMQDRNVFLGAGWDATDEIFNGYCDYWQLSSGDYPRLQYGVDSRVMTLEGSGTTRQPYLIRDASDLGAVWLKPHSTYRLESPLDLAGMTCSMALIPWFGGTLDGNGYAIRNMHVQGGGHLGLFASLGSGAILTNMNLEGADVKGTGRYVGGLAGRNNGSISHSGCASVVTGDTYVGGMVGFNGEYCIVFNSYSSGSVTGNRHVGGLAGYNKRGRIFYDHSTSSVKGDYFVGGLAGGNAWSGTVSNSYSVGEVRGNRIVGGLIGDNNWKGVITTSYSTGSTTGNDSVGGLVGENNRQGSIITASYSTGLTTGKNSVGGLLGKTSRQSMVTTSFSTGLTTGNNAVGGLVGDNSDGVISDSYCTGEVAGGDFVGGLAGINWEGVIANSYSTAPVTGNLSVHGLVGSNESDEASPGEINNSFWDVESSGVSQSRSNRGDRGTGLTTLDLSDIDTFLDAGWDFVDESINGMDAVWFLAAGDYPHLTWEIYPSFLREFHQSE